jgi:hypothetical protein
VLLSHGGENLRYFEARQRRDYSRKPSHWPRLLLNFTFEARDTVVLLLQDPVHCVRYAGCPEEGTQHEKLKSGGRYCTVDVGVSGVGNEFSSEYSSSQEEVSVDYISLL